MPHLNEVGDFLAVIRDYGIQTAKSEESEAVAITMRFEVFKDWDLEAKAWKERGRGEVVFGSSWIIKRDGTVSEKAHKRLITAAGWDGTFDSIRDKSWKPWVVRVTVEENFFEGNTSYRVSWINHGDSLPGDGGVKSVDDNTANALVSQHAQQLRASAAAIQQGIKHGVRKINVDTDNRLAITGAIRKVFREAPGKFDPRDYMKPAREAMAEVVKARMIAFGQAGWADKVPTKTLADLKTFYA